MYTLETNNTSPLCILCMLTPQTIPFFELTLVCTWYEVSTPWGHPSDKINNFEGENVQCK